jgi:hypothetical protein
MRRSPEHSFPLARPPRAPSGLRYGYHVRSLVAFLIATATACVGSQRPQPVAPARDAPLFPPNWNGRWLESDDHLTPAVPTRDPLDICSRDPTIGTALCRELTGIDDKDCTTVCLATYADAHWTRPTHPQAQPGAAGSAQPPAQKAEDPFSSALRECLVRARDSGGSEPATCVFARPLDEMGFGQTHCDAKCAALGAGYRMDPPRRSDGLSMPPARR